MNILFLTNKFITGGAERYILKKACYLKQAGYGVCVLSAGGDYTSQLKAQQIPYNDIPGLDSNLNLLDSWRLLQIMSAIGNAVQRNNIDIIEIDSPVVLELGITIAYIFNIPFVLNVFHEYAFKSRKDVGLLETCSRHGQLFFLSQSILNITSNHTGADVSKANILPIFIDPKELGDRGGTLDFVEDQFVFLAIARLTKEKKYINVVMDDYERFVIKYGVKRTVLIVVGDGDYLQHYQYKADKINNRIANNANKVLMTGNRNDIAAFYRRADVYIGMGTTVLEAAYFRKAVILASCYPDHKASIGYFSRMPYESVGEVIPSCVSFTPFCVLMNEVYSNKKLRQQLAEESYKKIEKHYLIGPVMNKWIEEYALLIRNKAAILSEDISCFVYKRDNIRIKMRKFQQLLN